MIHDLTKGKPLRVIIAFAIPILLGSLLQQVYYLVDSLIIAGSESLYSVAAVGSSSPIVTLSTHLATGFGVGVSVILAQLLGAHEYGDVRRAAAGIFVVFLGLSAVMTILGLIFFEPLLALMHTPEEVRSEAVGYLRVISIGYVFLVLFNFVAGALRGLGDSTTPLLILTVSSVLNIILDCLFVRIFMWGVTGAAVATVISQAVAAAAGIQYILTHSRMLRFTRRDLRGIRGHIKNYIAIIVPSGLAQSTHSIGAMMIQSLVNGFGATVIAGYMCATRVEIFLLLPISSMAVALDTFVGQNKGAGLIRRVYSGTRQTLLLGLGICGLYFFLLPLAAGQLMEAIAGAHADIIPFGSEQLTIFAFTCIFYCAMTIYINALRGAGDLRAAMIIAFAGSFVTREPLAYLLAALPGMEHRAVWLSQPIAWMIGALCAVIWFYKGRWRELDIVHGVGYSIYHHHHH